MKHTRLISTLVLVAAQSIALSVSAEPKPKAAATPASAPTPAAAAPAATPAAAPVDAPPPAQSPTCEPACRANYTCLRGSCVSICNPPCGDNETCTAQAACVAKPTPPAPPPSGAGYGGSSNAGAGPGTGPVYYPGESLDTSAAPRKGPTRKGFYLRMALGMGYFAGSSDVTVWTAPSSYYSPSGMRTESISLRGVSLVHELAIGGAVAPGVAIGGALYGTNVGSTKTKVLDYENSIGWTSVSVIGPFIDIYPVLNTGFHFGGSIGYAVASIGDEADVRPTGFGLTGGIGYEWPVDSKWSVGILGRLQYVHVNHDDLTSPVKAIIPGALFSATYF